MTDWCDYIFNPWSRHGPDASCIRASITNWRKPIAWNREAGAAQLAWSEAWAISGGSTPGLPSTEPRHRVFCGSRMDWLDPEVPAEWLADLLALIEKTPHLSWLLLTKRPELWRERVSLAHGELARDESRYTDAQVGFAGHWFRESSPRPPANVWIGVPIETQQDADERIPELLKIPARVRFLSCDPLLGPVELIDTTDRSAKQVGYEPFVSGIGIHWVTCAGETGPKARPMHPSWVRSLRDQCKEAGVPFHFGGWGAWEEGSATDGQDSICFTILGSGGHGDTHMRRVGKKLAGRLLDDVTHNEFPV